jgi:hypothetical protein
MTPRGTESSLHLPAAGHKSAQGEAERRNAAITPIIGNVFISVEPW